MVTSSEAIEKLSELAESGHKETRELLWIDIEDALVLEELDIKWKVNTRALVEKLKPHFRRKRRYGTYSKSSPAIKSNQYG